MAGDKPGGVGSVLMAHFFCPCLAGLRKKLVMGPILVLIAGSPSALAICPAPPPVVQEYKHSKVVIVGTVESERPVPQSWDMFDGTDFTVHIDQKVKGHQDGTIVIFSERTDDRFPMKVGGQYLLFLHEKYDRWQVNTCGNSSSIANAGQVIQELGHWMGND